MTLQLHADVVPHAQRRGVVRAAVVAVRPRQWTKSLFLVAAIVFAGELGDTDRLGAALVAVVAYCLASSAAYLVNDLHDVEADRRHPVKCDRPIARGELPQAAAVALTAALLLAAVALGATLGPSSLALLAGFLALQVLYTSVLRAVALVDVAAIAVLFVLRAAAGAVAIDVPVSPWLLLCTGLLALMLALGKRSAEAAGGSTFARPTLAQVPSSLVHGLLAVAAGATLVTYVAYTLAVHDGGALLLTTPLVALGIARYLRLVTRRRGAEDPENILLRDRPTLATVVAWAAACATLVQLG